jgi:phthalate 4,5-dioxygenase
MVASIPFSAGQGLFVPIDEENCWRYFIGPKIRPNPRQQLGSTDRAISRMRHILISAAKGLAEGKEPPAVAAGLDYQSIRGAEKILEPGEDWRSLGTGEDPVVREALGVD